MPTTDELIAATDKLRKTANEIAAAKRPVYTKGNDDVLWNFKTISRMTGLTVGQVLAVYMCKQFLSVVEGMTNAGNADPESSTRMPDSQNYLDLANVCRETGGLYEVG